MAILTKSELERLTSNMTQDQAKYVDDVKNIKCELDACCPDDECCSETACDDVLFVTKIMSFADKFKTLHWAAQSMSMHKTIDEFSEEIEEYKDAIAENIQSIIGQFKDYQFKTIELPIGSDPLCIINELKDAVNCWMLCHKDDMEYEAARSLTASFLEEIHKYIYLFRLCRSEKDIETCEKNDADLRLKERMIKGLATLDCIGTCCPEDDAECCEEECCTEECCCECNDECCTEEPVNIIKFDNETSFPVFVPCNQLANIENELDGQFDYESKELDKNANCFKIYFQSPEKRDIIREIARSLGYDVR